MNESGFILILQWPNAKAFLWGRSILTPNKVAFWDTGGWGLNTAYFGEFGGGGTQLQP